MLKVGNDTWPWIKAAIVKYQAVYVVIPSPRKDQIR